MLVSPLGRAALARYISRVGGEAALFCRHLGQGDVRVPGHRRPTGGGDGSIGSGTSGRVVVVGLPGRSFGPAAGVGGVRDHVCTCRSRRDDGRKPGPVDDSGFSDWAVGRPDLHGSGVAGPLPDRRCGRTDEDQQLARRSRVGGFHRRARGRCPRRALSLTRRHLCSRRRHVASRGAARGGHPLATCPAGRTANGLP